LAFGLIAAGSLALGWVVMSAGVFARATGGSGVVVSAPDQLPCFAGRRDDRLGPRLDLSRRCSDRVDRECRCAACGVAALVDARARRDRPCFARLLPLAGLARLGVVTGVWLLASGARTVEASPPVAT